MKKILLIALVVVSALGLAATIKEVNTKEEVTKLLLKQQNQHPELQ